VSERGRAMDAALNVLAGLGIAIALLLVFLVAPREATMGDVQRIFYFHVPASWDGYLALLVTLVASVLYLARREERWDRLAFCSAEIGLVFISAGIVSGAFWAKATWGVWWTWDPRLTTSAVLWVVYAAYLVLRQALDEPGRRARLSAVYSIAAFVAVPLNFMAIRWWRAAHPVVLGTESGGLMPDMVGVLLFCLGAFTLFYVVLLRERMRLQSLAERVEWLKDHRFI
jgi:heme exporter protein C